MKKELVKEKQYMEIFFYTFSEPTQVCVFWAMIYLVIFRNILWEIFN